MKTKKCSSIVTTVLLTVIAAALAGCSGTSKLSGKDLENSETESPEIAEPAPSEESPGTYSMYMGRNGLSEYTLTLFAPEDESSGMFTLVEATQWSFNQVASGFYTITDTGIEFYQNIEDDYDRNMYARAFSMDPSEIYQDEQAVNEGNVNECRLKLNYENGQISNSNITFSPIDEANYDNGDWVGTYSLYRGRNDNGEYTLTMFSSVEDNKGIFTLVEATHMSYNQVADGFYTITDSGIEFYRTMGDDNDRNMFAQAFSADPSELYQDGRAVIAGYVNEYRLKLNYENGQIISSGITFDPIVALSDQIEPVSSAHDPGTYSMYMGRNGLSEYTLTLFAPVDEIFGMFTLVEATQWSFNQVASGFYEITGSEIEFLKNVQDDYDRNMFARAFSMDPSEIYQDEQAVSQGYANQYRLKLNYENGQISNSNITFSPIDEANYDNGDWVGTYSLYRGRNDNGEYTLTMFSSVEDDKGIFTLVEATYMSYNQVADGFYEITGSEIEFIKNMPDDYDRNMFARAFSMDPSELYQDEKNVSEGRVNEYRLKLNYENNQISNDNITFEKLN